MKRDVLIMKYDGEERIMGDGALRIYFELEKAMPRRQRGLSFRDGAAIWLAEDNTLYIENLEGEEHFLVEFKIDAMSLVDTC